MMVRGQGRRLGGLGLASLIILIGLTLGSATGETPEPPMGLAAVQPAMPMPAFSLANLQGKDFNASALKDKVVVIRFWATW
jgi:cytochrome oxidase Cu insertion factor (SCO1/SenC/PrrC family)